MAGNDSMDIKKRLDSINELLQRFVTLLSEWKVANDKHMACLDELANQLSASVDVLENATLGKLTDSTMKTDNAVNSRKSPVVPAKRPPLKPMDLQPNKRIKITAPASLLADANVDVKKEIDANVNQTGTTKNQYSQPIVVLSPLKVKLEKANSMVVIGTLNDGKAGGKAEGQINTVRKTASATKIVNRLRFPRRITRSKKLTPVLGRVDSKSSARSKLIAPSSKAIALDIPKMIMEAREKKQKTTVQRPRSELINAQTSKQKNSKIITKRNSLL